MKPIFIIEHLEPKLYPWCLIEYKHISKVVGKESLWFTNMLKINNKKELEGYGNLIDESVKKIKLENACVLDPNAKKTLNPKEAKNFRYYILGGILGDYPPKQRTKDELTKFIDEAEVRNIGKEQMSTDNAALVVKEIIGGKRLSELAFKDGIEIPIDKIASIQLPYRYRIIKGEPFISQELVIYLKNKKGF